MHLTGIEPTHPAPEAGALSTELQMQVVLYFHLTFFAIPFFKKMPAEGKKNKRKSGIGKRGVCDFDPKWRQVVAKYVESGD